MENTSPMSSCWIYPVPPSRDQTHDRVAHAFPDRIVAALPTGFIAGRLLAFELTLVIPLTAHRFHDPANSLKCTAQPLQPTHPSPAQDIPGEREETVERRFSLRSAVSLPLAEPRRFATESRLGDLANARRRPMPMKLVSVAMFGVLGLAVGVPHGIVALAVVALIVVMSITPTKRHRNGCRVEQWR
jgi:hypothetical protein